MGMIDRHRSENGDINRQYGTTHVRTLRATYGGAFASGFSPNAKLSEILHDLDPYSLQQLADDHAAGKLGQKIEHHSRTAA